MHRLENSQCGKILGQVRGGKAGHIIWGSNGLPALQATAMGLYNTQGIVIISLPFSFLVSFLALILPHLQSRLQSRGILWSSTGEYEPVSDTQLRADKVRARHIQVEGFA